MEPKKIIIKKNAVSSSQHHQNTKKQDALTILENTVKKLTNRFEQYGFNDSKEEEFLVENKGKTLIVELQDKKIEGTLEYIDKYRICITVDNKKHYFYKHAIMGYSVKE